MPTLDFPVDWGTMSALIFRYFLLAIIMSTPSCAIISLGCPKTLVDSEQILGLLQRGGLRVVLEPEEADVVVVNTCGFLEASREESLAEIHAMEALRKDPQAALRCLIVAGCLVSRDGEALIERCPNVDVFLDVFSRERVLDAVQETLKGQTAPRFICGASEAVTPDEHRFPLLPPHVAYLKIAEGCNRRCAFCAIPNIRGNYSSKPLPQVLAEAKQLVENGVRELVLIAQDTSFYGRDLAGTPEETSLAELLGALGKISGLRWIRVLYLYPQYFDDALIEAFASTPNVVPYLDMPLQHINDRIFALHAAGRHAGADVGTVGQAAAADTPSGDSDGVYCWLPRRDRSRVRRASRLCPQAAFHACRRFSILTRGGHAGG